MSTFTHYSANGSIAAICDTCGETFATEHGPALVHWKAEHVCAEGVAA